MMITEGDIKREIEKVTPCHKIVSFYESGESAVHDNKILFYVTFLMRNNGIKWQTRVYFDKDVK